jgi:hypothetical protein
MNSEGECEQAARAQESFFHLFPVQVEATEQESNRSGLLGYTERFCPEDPN